MEKENKFKLKLSNFFSSSCKTQNLSEVIDHSKTPIFTTQNTIFLQAPLIEEQVQNDVDDDENENYPLSTHVIKPKRPSSYSSSLSSSNSSAASSLMSCKPRCPETFDQMIRENCIISAAGNTLYRRKVTGRHSLLSPFADFSGRMCPPVSPASPLFLKQGKDNSKKKKKKRDKTNKGKPTHFSKKGFNPNPFSFSSSNETENGDWFSSDDEREDDGKQAMFSLKSLSFSSKSISLSSDSHDNNPGRVRTRVQTQTRRRPWPRRRKPGSRPKEVGVVPLEGKVKDTFAVVKSSSDPYNDFRTSMVEMIIEKQIFGAKELEQLLQCFLSLNSTHHHRVIVKVFTEIWDALFSHFS